MNTLTSKNIKWKTGMKYAGVFNNIVRIQSASPMFAPSSNWKIVEREND